MAPSGASAWWHARFMLLGSPLAPLHPQVKATHPNTPLTLYANGSGGLLERMAACWNACDGIKTKDLERYYSVGDGIDKAIEEAGLSDHVNAIKQRDELLDALIWARDGGEGWRELANAAIEKAIGKSSTPVNDTVKLHRAGSFGGAE